MRTRARQTIRVARARGEGAANLGGLENAREIEDFVTGLFLKLAPIFYRFAGPGEL